MGKILITALISILPFNDISHPHEEDPFTTYIQEKLIGLWVLNLIIELTERLFLRFGKRIVTVEK